MIPRSVVNTILGSIDECHLENPYLRCSKFTVDDEDRLLVVSDSPNEGWSKDRLDAIMYATHMGLDVDGDVVFVPNGNPLYVNIKEDINTTEFVRGLRNITISFAESTHIDRLSAEMYIDRAIENSRAYGLSMEEAISRLSAVTINKDIK